MTVAYTYTAADFKEAETALAQFNSSESAKAGGKSSQKSGRFSRGFWGWILCVVLGIILFNVVRHDAVPHPRMSGTAFSSEAPPTHNFLLTVIPSAVAPLLLTAITAWAAAQAGMPGRVPFYAPKRVASGFSPIIWRVLAWLSLAVFLGGVICFSYLPDTLNWRPGRIGLFAVAFLPWVGWLFLLKFVSRLFKKYHPGRLGHEESSTRLPQQLEMAERGLIVTHAVCRHEFYWGYFVSYLESANLLLLYTKDLTSLVIPKRAFTDLRSLEQFCGLLQARIPAGQFLPRASGFQVLPLPLPPVPAIPVDGR